MVVWQQRRQSTVAKELYGLDKAVDARRAELGRLNKLIGDVTAVRDTLTTDTFALAAEAAEQLAVGQARGNHT